MVYDLGTLQPLRIEVIITKATDIKMEEDFENLANILRDWAKDKIQKGFVEALARYEKQEEKKAASLENDTKLNTKLVFKLTFKLR